MGAADHGDVNNGREAMTTRERVAALRVADPKLTLQSIGDQVGVTRERVRQLLNEANLPTRAVRELKSYPCKYCGEHVASHKKAHRRCGMDAKTIYVRCHWCEKGLRRTPGTLFLDDPAHKGRYYCNKTCFGRWFGTTHGFAANRQNIRSGLEARREQSANSLDSWRGGL